MNGINFTTLQPPISTPLMNSRGILSSEWRQFFSGLNYFLAPFQNAIPVPSRTQDQINSLTGVANGRIIYNNTNNSFQGYVDGTWKTFNLS